VSLSAVSLSTGHIARVCARRPWLTLGAWIGALVLGIGLVVTFLDLTTEGNVTSNPESEQGYALIGKHFPPDPTDEWVNELVVIRSQRHTVRDRAFRGKVSRLLSTILLSPGVHNAKSVYSSNDRQLVSKDGHATVIPVGLQGDCEVSADEVMGIVRGREAATSRPG
jgi:uncharacterized membrane protein YdfJ with MMPL/SSD domain